jgi:galactokinase
VGRFRDFYPEYLGISTAQLYEMLKTLPIRATRAEIAEWLPEHRETLDATYQSHREEPGGYRLRGVCLYGMAECERSRRALEFLRQGNIEPFGELIDLSHEGDRVCVHGSQLFEPDIGDAYLDQLIRETAKLYCQPGAYAASCKELDVLVDMARSVRGVLGAGLIGAGLGGCISVFVKADGVEELIQTLQRDYYHKHGFNPFIEVCTPVARASVMQYQA